MFIDVDNFFAVNDNSLQVVKDAFVSRKICPLDPFDIFLVQIVWLSCWTSHYVQPAFESLYGCLCFVIYFHDYLAIATSSSGRKWRGENVKKFCRCQKTHMTILNKGNREI